MSRMPGTNASKSRKTALHFIVTRSDRRSPSFVISKTPAEATVTPGVLQGVKHQIRIRKPFTAASRRRRSGSPLNHAARRITTAPKSAASAADNVVRKALAVPRMLGTASRNAGDRVRHMLMTADGEPMRQCRPSQSASPFRLRFPESRAFYRDSALTLDKPVQASYRERG